jgi:S-formylglutathione hydrolase FrmB
MTNYARSFLFLALFGALNTFALDTASNQVSSVHPLQTDAAKQNRQVQTVLFESKLVGKTLPYKVVLPVDYNRPSARTRRYPVLYLLHGLAGHYDNWTTLSKLPDYAARYPMIVVTPEGNDGWYTASATMPAEKYESYIPEELVPDVQRRFRTIESREGRSIAGLSMGGYGALKFGVKHPEMFVFAGSMSGALGAALWTEADLRGFEAIWKTLAPVYGPENSPTRAANDLSRLYRELPKERIASLPYVYLDCGTEDPLLQSSRSLVEILLTRKIPHEYHELPGNHDWAYWDAQVQEVLKIAAQKMRGPAASMKKPRIKNWTRTEYDYARVF